MGKKNKDTEIELEMVNDVTEQEATTQIVPEEKKTAKGNGKKISAKEEIALLKERATEDDNAPINTLTLRKILGGDILSAQMVRRQVWLCLLISLFLTIYVAFRYQCQQDMIDIAQLENDLVDAKYKALSSSSNLTERCRESQMLEMLRANQDSTLHASSQPPYKIYVREE